MLFNKKKKISSKYQLYNKSRILKPKKPPVHRGLFLKHYELLSLIKQHWEYIEHLQKIKELQYSVDSAFLA